MKTVRIYGVGRMGSIIAHAFYTLGYNVEVADVNPTNITAVRVNTPVTIKTINSDLKDVDLVFSAMPYHQNEPIAKKALSYGVPYADLGGHIGTSEAINDMGRAGGVSCLTDVGLAPGLANIMAEEVYRQEIDLGSQNVHTVKMYCGGMPQKDNVVHYARTWSMDGLLNEYMDISKYLQDGKIKETAGMSLLQDYYIDGTFDKFEAFITSGAAHTTLKSMQARGVKNCCYKTIRHRGHAKLFVHLYNSICAVQKQEKELISIIYPETTEDMVYVSASAFSETSNSQINILAYAKDGLTAMQRMTAYPATAAAHLMMTHKISSYADIPWKEFATITNKLLGEKIL